MTRRAFWRGDWRAMTHARYRGRDARDQSESLGCSGVLRRRFRGRGGRRDDRARGPGAGVCKTLTLRDGRLIGAALVGETDDALWYRDLIRDGTSVAPFRDDLIFGRAFCRLPEPRRVAGSGVMAGDFTSDQKRYLEGFVSGIEAMRGAEAGARVAQAQRRPGPTPPTSPRRTRPSPAGRSSPTRRKWKRAEHPFDAYARLKAQAKAGAFPKPDDNFRWRYFGLFYVAPAQQSYMLRLRIPNGILSHWQFAGIADLAERYAGGYAHVTTRANLQIARNRAGSCDGQSSRRCRTSACARAASGADNIRNVTGSATAGIDPQELFDTRPSGARVAPSRPQRPLALRPAAQVQCRLRRRRRDRRRSRRPTTSAFQAVRIGEGRGVEPGVWFRIMVGGITGHRDLARDAGVYLPRRELRQRRRRDRARLHRERRPHGPRQGAAEICARSRWGLDKFLAAVEARLGRPLTAHRRFGDRARVRRSIAPRISACIAQAQAGLNWIGVALPVGRMTAEQMRGAARGSRRDFGDGDLRLTVWQNLLLSGVPDGRIEAAKAAIEALGPRLAGRRRSAPAWSPAPARRAAISPPRTPRNTPPKSPSTSTRGCKLDAPVNIHLTGCHHSCAQHYIGDIGLMAREVAGRRGRRDGRGLHDRRRRRLRRSRAHRPRTSGATCGRRMRRQGRGPAARLSRTIAPRSRRVSRPSPRATSPMRSELLRGGDMNVADSAAAHADSAGARRSRLSSRRGSTAFSPPSSPPTARLRR